MLPEGEKRKGPEMLPQRLILMHLNDSPHHRGGAADERPAKPHLLAGGTLVKGGGGCV